jgi:hypothetical protein
MCTQMKSLPYLKDIIETCTFKSEQYQILDAIVALEFKSRDIYSTIIRRILYYTIMM